MSEKDFNYELIVHDYVDFNDEDDDMLYSLREAINKLTPVERKIFLTYCELQTFSATARQFNVSGPCIKSYILNIKSKILNNL